MSKRPGSACAGSTAPPTGTASTEPVVVERWGESQPYRRDEWRGPGVLLGVSALTPDASSGLRMCMLGRHHHHRSGGPFHSPTHACSDMRPLASHC